MNLDALREFVAVLGPILRTHFFDEAKKNARDLAPLLLALERLLPELFDDRERIKALAKRYEDRLKLVEKPQADDGSKRLEFHFTGDGEEEFHTAMHRLTVTANQQDLLHRVSLVALISYAEWFLSDVLHTYYEKYPKALGRKDKVLSLEDLLAFESLDEAKRRLIDLRIEDILRGGFEDWLDFLTNRLQLSMGYLSDHRSLLRETFQRRNLIVHNGGIVNSIYFSKVEPELRPALDLGAAIDVSREYLDEAIGRFEICFILIAAELWKKLQPDDEARASALWEVCWQHLNAERWVISEPLAKFVTADKLLSERARTVAALNYWQSLKWQDRFDEVRTDVEALDCSAKEPVFRLAQLALLDDEAAFFELLPTVIRSGGISEDDLRNWPIFRRMRQAESYVKTYGYDGANVGGEETTAETL